MNKSFFQKRSVGLAPLASVRDWAILSVIVVGVLCLREAVVLWSLMDEYELRSVSIGVVIGMLPSVLMCLPVRGVVDGLSSDALHAFLRSVKFTRHVEQDGTQFYTQDTPSWMRWDSNRISIKSLTNGQLSVSMPVYCYRILRRRR